MRFIGSKAGYYGGGDTTDARSAWRTEPARGKRGIEPSRPLKVRAAAWRRPDDEANALRLKL